MPKPSHVFSRTIRFALRVVKSLRYVTQNTTLGISFIASAIGPEALGQKVAHLV